MPAYRLALLADIHGNLPAYRAVMDQALAESPDVLLFAGDLTGGPGDEVIFDDLRQTAARLPIYMVRGNAEDYIARMEDGSAPPEWHFAQQFAMLRWTFARASAAFRASLRSLPARLSIEFPGAAPIALFHGTPRSRTEHLRPAINPPALVEAFAATTETVLVCGHSHEQWLERDGERVAMSPGAVCAPLDGRTGAQYAMLEWDGAQWQADFRCIPYCFDDFASDMRESGLLATGYLARAHLSSIYHGGNWGLNFLRHAGDLAARTGIVATWIPDDIWELAGQTFFAEADDGKISG